MGEAITLEQRLDTVLNGGIPDRVPCIPLVYYFAATYARVPFQDFMMSMESYRRAMDCCFRDLGAWDAMYPLPLTMDAPHYDITWGAGVGMKPKIPEGGGEEAKIWQLAEKETLMDEADYADIIACPLDGHLHPLLKFMVTLIARLDGESPDMRFWLLRFFPRLLRLGARWASEFERWRLRGIPNFISFSLEAPFNTFSMARGLPGFSRDLFERPEEVRQASLKLARSASLAAGLVCRLFRLKRFLLLCHRTSNDFISPGQFVELAYPSLKLVAEELAKHRIIFAMHLDGNWDLNLETMLDLPENTCFQFDGSTDIFRARKILGDRYTIMGDVPADMLTVGSPTEVEDYSIKLIREVGAQGRFILSSGCEVPANARPENVKAMIDAAKKYGRY